MARRVGASMAGWGGRGGGRLSWKASFFKLAFGGADVEFRRSFEADSIDLGVGK